jgi:hypothetical protein
MPIDPESLPDPERIAARVSDKLWSMEDIVALIDAREPAPAKRGPYKKREAA